MKKSGQHRPKRQTGQSPVRAHAEKKNDDTEVMRPKGTTSNGPDGLTRRELISMGLLGLSTWMLPPLGTAHAALQGDLDLVSRIPDMDERDGPLLIFRDFEADADLEVERHLRRQMDRRSDLHARLKRKIGFEKQVALSIEALDVQLMFVPQVEQNHTAAYQRFCRDVTDYFFEMVQEDSFYAAITSPRRNYPATSDSGISAFLVHRLAKAYRAVCRFTAESGRSVAYRASGAIFSNHVGAVDLEIEVLAAGRFGLKRKPFTIWQNDTDSLSTLMSVPVEETLHYYLGRATDREIASCIVAEPPQTLQAAWRLAEEWMAVEESVVGGLVSRFLNGYCRRYQLDLPLSSLGGVPVEAPVLPQYRYRDRGVRMVEDLGPREVMALYMHSPAAFRDQLLRQQDA